VGVALVDGAVVLLLEAGQLDLDDRLLLGRDGLLDVGLHAAEQEGLDRRVQPLHRLGRVERAEAPVEVVDGRELVRRDKV
jgi:hypothetical protein